MALAWFGLKRSGETTPSIDDRDIEPLKESANRRV
jgi:hypothetical protein